MGPANVLDNKISHDFPFGYFASDSFWHHTFADTVAREGSFKYYPYSYNGGFEKITAFNPGLFYQLSSLFASLTNLEVYDSTIFLVYLLGILSIFTAYIMIRAFNKTIALFSLPLMILIFSRTFKIDFMFGSWLYVAASYFLVLSLFLFTKIDVKYSFVLLGLSLAAIMNTHVPEFIFIFGFIILYFLIKLLAKQLKKSELVAVFYAMAIALSISLYYLIIFKFVWMDMSPYHFSIKKFSEFSGSIFPKLIDFNYIALSIIFIGIVAMLLFLKNRTHPSILGSLFMFIFGFSHWAGFESRSLQTRYFWPIYLSIFFGIALYFIMNKFIKNHKDVASHSISLFLILLLLFYYYEKVDSQGIMDKFHWDTFNFLDKNTEEKSKVAFLWSDIYDQKAILTNSKRQTFYVIQDVYFKAIQDRKIDKMYDFEVISEKMSPQRSGVFNFKFLNPPGGSHDLCSFDYYVIDSQPAASRIPQAIQYNTLLRDELLKNDFFEQVYNNQLTVILKNKKPGEKCIEPKNF